MATGAVPDLAPPIEVLIQFLYALQHTVTPYDRIVPVLRGSTIMKHWFGDAARPSADIDLEWFPQAGWRDRAAVSPVEHGRRLSMFAVGHHDGSPIQFDPDIPVPSDGVSLWEYDTPGIRCYTGWTWPERNLRGVLQVDLAQAGAYDLTGVATETLDLPREGKEPACLRAYTPEMLLAAKISWIVRHLRRVEHQATGEKADQLTFAGEPKDLFDAHLLLMKGRLRPEVFQSSFLAVAMEDKLDWHQLDVVLDEQIGLPSDEHYPTWAAFAGRHMERIHERPSDMLRTVVTRLRSLLGDIRQHVPFFRSIQADPTDEVAFLLYADWLEERADPRAAFLRLFCQSFFHGNRSAGGILASSLSSQPGGWLYHLFGGAERARDLRKRIEALA